MSENLSDAENTVYFVLYLHVVGGKLQTKTTNDKVAKTDPYPSNALREKQKI